mgnify:CR=1 FL=1
MLLDVDLPQRSFVALAAAVRKAERDGDAKLLEEALKPAQAGEDAVQRMQMGLIGAKAGVATLKMSDAARAKFGEDKAGFEAAFRRKLLDSAKLSIEHGTLVPLQVAQLSHGYVQYVRSSEDLNKEPNDHWYNVSSKERCPRFTKRIFQ